MFFICVCYFRALRRLKFQRQYLRRLPIRLRNLHARNCILIAAVCIMAACLIVATGSPLLSIPLLIGLSASRLLYVRRFGFDTGLINGICHVSVKTDCDVVSKSIFANFAGISLSTLSMAYFLSQAILPIISGLKPAEAIMDAYFVSVFAALPIASYSILSQVRIRKYCPLCIAVILAIFAEALVWWVCSGQIVGMHVLMT